MNKSAWNGGIEGCAEYKQSSSRRAFFHFLSLVAVMACLPVTGAFSSPAVRSPLFSSRPRLHFIERQGSTPPTRSIIDHDHVSHYRRKTPIVFTKRSDRYYHSKKLFPDFFPDVEVSRTDRILVTLMSAAMFMAFAELMSISGPGAWRYFLAGGICASTSHAITTPIDVVKVRY